MRKRPTITKAALRMRKSRKRDADAKKKNGDRIRFYLTPMLDSQVEELLDRTELKIPEEIREEADDQTTISVIDHKWKKFVVEVIAAAAISTIKK